MLKHLKRWLGWESDSDLLDFASVGSRAPAPPPAPKTTVVVQSRPAQQAPATPRPAKPERQPLDVLDDPRLTLDKPPNDGFDPYNTGAFNRSTSWERIGRNRKR
jgi:hypothetical protein